MFMRSASTETSPALPWDSVLLLMNPPFSMTSSPALIRTSPPFPVAGGNMKLSSSIRNGASVRNEAFADSSGDTVPAFMPAVPVIAGAISKRSSTGSRRAGAPVALVLHAHRDQ